MASVVLSQMRYGSLCTPCRPYFVLIRYYLMRYKDVLGHKLIKRSWQINASSLCTSFFLLSTGHSLTCVAYYLYPNKSLIAAVSRSLHNHLLLTVALCAKTVSELGSTYCF